MQDRQGVAIITAKGETPLGEAEIIAILQEIDWRKLDISYGSIELLFRNGKPYMLRIERTIQIT